MVAGSCQSNACSQVRKSDGTPFDDSIVKESRKILRKSVSVVPSDFDFAVSDDALKAFTRLHARPNDDQALLIQHFGAYCNTGALLPECHIPLDGVVEKKKTSLVTLLKTIPDDAGKEKIIDRVMSYHTQLTAMLLYAPRGQRNFVVQIGMVDNRAEVMACIQALSS